MFSDYDSGSYLLMMVLKVLGFNVGWLKVVDVGVRLY